MVYRPPKVCLQWGVAHAPADQDACAHKLASGIGSAFFFFPFLSFFALQIGSFRLVVKKKKTSGKENGLSKCRGVLHFQLKSHSLCLFVIPLAAPPLREAPPSRVFRTNRMGRENFLGLDTRASDPLVA